MNFDLSEDQRALKSTVERLMSREYSFESRAKHATQTNGWSETAWKQYADIGLLGMSFSEADGGFGGGPVEQMIAMEAFGRSLVLEPFVASIVLSGGLLRHGANDEMRARLVPSLVDGSLRLAFAHSEPGVRYNLADVSTTAHNKVGEWCITGHKALCLHGDSANALLVSARVHGMQRDESGIAVFRVEAGAAGVKRQSYQLLDGSRAADVVFDNAAAELIIPPERGLAAIERTCDEAIGALAAEAVGAMAVLHSMTVEYLKTRKQFGVPIGSFQALQHRAVDMLVTLEQARSMAMFAAMAVVETDPVELAKASSAVKVQIGRSSRFISQQAIQLHGGIGMALECQAGHYVRRLMVIESLLGDADFHLQRLARLGGLIEP